MRAIPAVLMVALIAQPAHGQEGGQESGQEVGRTSYLTLPFVREVWQVCWGCSPYLEPGELFFRSNPASLFNDPAAMATARAGAAALAATGLVPAASQQRWQDTYAASFPPGTFATAPANVAADEARGHLSTDAAFVAWRTFVAGHPQYWDVAFDGGTMPSEATFRAWGGQWGHISPLTPLDPADCPGQAACTYGDFYADRWARVAALTGATGIALSDFADSQPHRTSNWHDFNPRIVAAFAHATGPVPAGPISVQAQWIVARDTPAWNDFLSQGYGAFYRALDARIARATGHPALVIDQGSQTASYRRWVGTDQRLLARQIAPQHYLCLWDDHVIQTDRPGPVARPPLQELAGAVVAAAREPAMRNGANLEADDAAYRAAIATFYPTLDPAARAEIGAKLLKRLWLWSAWAHIADRDGHVRRALAFVSRDYWDTGTIPAPLATLIRSVVPTQPFGPALYYSTAVERQREQTEAAAAGVGATVGFYLDGPVLQAFVDGGGGFGYYVSDAALARIARGQANAPSAWIVLDARGTLPEAERARLAAIAPIVTTPALLAALPEQPLALTGGLTGFGFYDQSHRLIVVVSNPGTAADAAPLAGTIRLRLPATATATATATDLFSGTTETVAASAGRAIVPITVPRWDTRVLALTTP